MLTKHIQEKARRMLEINRKRIRNIRTVAEFERYKRSKIDFIKKTIMWSEKDRRTPLNPKSVSRIKRNDCVIENVIYEVFPGYYNNVSVVIPVDFSPPYPVIIVPTGHSAKWARPHQGPPLIFARHGFLSVFYDSPMFGEKTKGFDHFRHGGLTYLTGANSFRYFGYEAIRTIDYIETRKDVDMGFGVGMTGVSGGGMTTIDISSVDDRIKVIAPVCCVAPFKRHPVEDLYTGCPENFWTGRIAQGLDVSTTIGLSAPKPCLMVNGLYDEVFKHEWFIEAYKEARHFYELYHATDKLSYFSDYIDHNYSLKMAEEVARWMERHLLGREPKKLPYEDMDKFGYEKEDNLKCGIENSENIFSCNVEISEKLKRERENIVSENKLLGLLGLTARELVTVPNSKTSKRNVWNFIFEDVLLKTDKDVYIDGLLFSGNWDKAKATATDRSVVYIDKQDRWSRVKQNGVLVNIANAGYSVLAVECRGWGATRPEPAQFDFAGWCDIDVILSYISFMMETPVLGMRVRDAVLSANFLREKRNAKDVYYFGREEGSIVALFAFILDRKAKGCFLEDVLFGYELLVKNENYRWKEDNFIPGILKHFDIKDVILSEKKRKMGIINFRDAKKELFSPKRDMFKNKRNVCFLGNNDDERDTNSKITEWFSTELFAIWNL